MASIELALSDERLRSNLKNLLAENGLKHVDCVDTPGQRPGVVLVVDSEHFHRLALPIQHPERVVLIGNDRLRDFNEAWNAGVQSVVLRGDPIGTAVLAVLSACLSFHHPAQGFPALRSLSGHNRLLMRVDS